MNASFGLDHPLVATRDIEALRARLIAMGFNMTSIGWHPWGTSTSLAMFDGCLLEIMGIYDETLIDEVPAGSFRFGRHIHEHLAQREGVALTALHSTDSRADAETAAGAGLQVAGHLEFSRKVTLPDGTSDDTRTTLALLPDAEFPRLSFFLCQQHRPDLIYVPQWLRHPNTVCGISGVNVIAQKAHFSRLVTRLEGLYPCRTECSDTAIFDTPNGRLQVMTPGRFERQIGAVPQACQADDLPFIAGIDFRVADPMRLVACLKQSGDGFRQTVSGIVLNEPSDTANTVFRFMPDSR